MQKFILLLAICLPLAAQTKINGSRVIEGTLNYCADAGSNDTYACNLNPAITAYTTGACYRFKANTANTGAATISFNAIGAKTIKKVAGGVTTDLSDNDIRAGQIADVCYDGTNMQMQSTLGNAASSNTASGWWYPIMYSGSTGNLDIGTDAICHNFMAWNQVQTNVIGVNVTTESGTGCTGGTCGFLVAIYDSTKAKIATSEVIYSGHATSTKNINTTGYKRFGWSSGSAVSGGTLTLTPGKYWACYLSDSGTLAFAVTYAGAFLYDEQNASTGSDAHGYKAGLSSGNGASLSIASSWSGSLTLTGGSGGERVIRMTFGYE